MALRLMRLTLNGRLFATIKHRTLTRKKDISPILYTVGGEVVDAIQAGEIAEDLTQAENTESNSQALTTRRSTRKRKRSDKVENNR